MRRRASTALFAVVLVAAVWGLLQVGWYAHGQITDYGVYRHYGDAIAHTHAVPYRDFPLEYPPAARPSSWFRRSSSATASTAFFRR